MTGFVAFATIPLKTEGLSDKDRIGHAACLLRANRATLQLVARFYEEPLLNEMRLALGIPYSEPIEDRHIVSGFAETVQNVFLDHVLEPNIDFVQPEHVTVCFDAQNPVHALEISRYWQVKFKDELYRNLLTLGPWTPGSCCGNDGTMEPVPGVVLPTINGAGPKYDLPRTRECSPDYDVDPVPVDTWNAIASTIDSHLLGCTGELFGAFAPDGQGAP
ncbi:hypothetical protein B0T20DRAFT_360460 [Sordaria brevicollis]|uniref:Uncharacterized protein n=1 Tax=Sordaria brevicollis TaxID=83679 RepID=A0AAE0P3Q7_SORBR|nr:hypothetical protein B0T20DRAFT_360460 [Sordaria brevicollis]